MYCSYYFSRHPREIASSYIKIPTDHLSIYIYILVFTTLVYHYFRGNREVGNRHENVSSRFHHHRPGQTCACSYINTSYYTIYQYIILYYFIRLDYILYRCKRVQVIRYTVTVTDTTVIIVIFVLILYCNGREYTLSPLQTFRPHTSPATFAKQPFFRPRVTPHTVAAAGISA